MESVLGGFQASLGSVSEEIKQLQSQSYHMNLRLRNRRQAEERLGKFLEDMVIPETLIQVLAHGEIDDDYMANL